MVEQLGAGVPLSTTCEAWLADCERRAAINPRTFYARGSAWLGFDSHPCIVYKTAKGYVDLHVGDHGFTGSTAELEAAIAGFPVPDGFTITVDTSNKPILRFADPAIVVDADLGPPVDVAGVETALHAVTAAIRWLDSGADAVLRRTRDVPPHAA